MKFYVTLTSIICLFALTVPLLINYTFKDSTSVLQDTSDNSAETDNNRTTVSVFNSSSGVVNQVDLKEYLIGVVAGEMPASFCEEALKAQVVASYTYSKYIFENSTNNYITDSPDIHQCYINISAQKAKWGESYEIFRNKIESAVNSVYGEYISYENETAMSVFHASSAERTLSAEEVWGTPIPYLVSVECTMEEKIETQISYKSEELRKQFEEAGKVIFKTVTPDKMVVIKEADKNGYIKKLTVGDKTFSAAEVKEILNLPGINFKAKRKKDIFIFSVIGKGHGVGMSQYAAEYMALQGKNYKEILAHFYPGTKIEKEENI